MIRSSQSDLLPIIITFASPGEYFFIYSIQLVTLSNECLSINEKHNNIPSEPLKNPFVNDLNLSYPAVSHIYNLILKSFIFSIYILKSIAIVDR